MRALNHKVISSVKGTMLIEFLVLIPIIITIILFTLEMQNYLSTTDTLQNRVKLGFDYLQRVNTYPPSEQAQQNTVCLVETGFLYCDKVKYNVTGGNIGLDSVPFIIQGDDILPGLRVSTNQNYPVFFYKPILSSLENIYTEKYGVFLNL